MSERGSLPRGFSLIEDLAYSQGDMAYVITLEPDGTSPEFSASRPIDSNSLFDIQDAYMSAFSMSYSLEDDSSLDNLFSSKLSKSTRKAEIFAGKKYKPVALKTRPILSDLPSKFRILRNIQGDPLEAMPKLEPVPPEYTEAKRYTKDRKEKIDQVHNGDFLWSEERKLLHHFMTVQEEAFAWDDSERGRFRDDFFPPVEMPVVEHKPWVLRNIPIPPGKYEEICAIIKKKIEAGVYEPSNSAYRSRWFCVEKKNGSL